MQDVSCSLNSSRICLGLTRRAETNRLTPVALPPHTQTRRSMNTCLVAFLFADKVPSSIGALQMAVVAKDYISLKVAMTYSFHLFPIDHSRRYILQLMRLANLCNFNAIHPVTSLNVRVTELIVPTDLLTH